MQPGLSKFRLQPVQAERSRCSRWAYALFAVVLLIATLPAMARAQDCDNDPACLPPIGTPPDQTWGGGSSGNGSGSGSGNGGVHLPPGPKSGSALPTSQLSARMKPAAKIFADEVTLTPAPSSSGYAVDQNPLDDEDSSGLYRDAGTLPARQARSLEGVLTQLPHSEPVAGDGEFVLDEIDLDFAGFAIPFEFHRYYRSGVSYQTPLGFGWGHSFLERIVPAPLPLPPIVALNTTMLLLTERLDRVRFNYSDALSTPTLDVYIPQAAGSMVLSRTHGDPNAVWSLTDGHGLTREYNRSTGNLQRIYDQGARHQLKIAWVAAQASNQSQTDANQAPMVVDTVTDTTGRVIYFVYQTVSAPPGDPSLSYPVIGDLSYQFLQCLSFTKADCSAPLVSYTVSPIIALSQPQQGYALYGGKLQTQYQGIAEFNLAKVSDANGYGPSYFYQEGPQKSYMRQFFGPMPSRDAALQCSIWQQPTKPPAPTTDPCVNMSYAIIEQVCGPVCVPSTSEEAAEGVCDDKISQCIKKLEKSHLQSMLKQCHATALAECQARTPSTYTYGTPPEIYHNLIEVDDADSRAVVRNTYGVDPTLPSFDRVTHQVLGGDPRQSLDYAYHELSVEKAHGAVGGDQALYQGLTSFAPERLCSPLGIGVGPVVTSASPAPINLPQSQNPALAIIEQASGGSVRTLYLDAAGRILRDVNDINGATTDYNYVVAGISGMRTPAGMQTCIGYDPAGQEIAVSEVPAKGKLGQTIDTAIKRDAAEKIVEVQQHVGARLISDRVFNRDKWERIYAIGDTVDSTHTRWSCYGFADLLTIQPIAFHRDVRAEALAFAPKAGADGLPEPTSIHPYILPCRLFGAGGTGFDVTPSTIVRPDGRVTLLSNLGPAGAGDIVVDAGGAAPLRFQYTFDAQGALTQTAQLDPTTGGPLLGTMQSWDRDPTELVVAAHRASVADPSQTMTTTFTYDRSRHLATAEDDRLTRVFSSDPLSRLTSLVETPTPGAGGQARATCWGYDVAGHLTTEIRPEGGVRSYNYDAAGNLVTVNDGPVIAPAIVFGAFAAPCAPAVAQFPVTIKPGPVAATPSLVETMASFSYDTSGQVTIATINGETARFDYDGFSRRIDVILDHPLTGSATHPPSGNLNPQVHHAIGYDGLNLAWEAVLDAYPTSGALPSTLVSGMHAAVAYSYDMVGRETKVDLWQFTESPLAMNAAEPHAVTNLAFDDARNVLTETQPNGLVNQFTSDGDDRIVKLVEGVGSNDPRQNLYAYAEGGMTVTVTHSPAPTTSGILTRVAHFSGTGDLLELDQQGQRLAGFKRDAHGRLVELDGPGGWAQRYAYDAYDQLLTTLTATSAAVFRPTLTRSFDRDGRLVSIRDGDHHVTTQSFDLQGRLSVVTDGLGAIQYSYNPGSDLIAKVAGPAGTTVDAYDIANVLVSETTTPAAGHLAPDVRRYDYSATGEIATASVQSTAGLETLSFNYDSLGRVVRSSTTALPYTIAHAYGPSSDQITISGGASPITLTRQWTLFGEPHALIHNTTLAVGWTYAQGALGEIDYVGGASEHLTYDDQARVVSMTVQKSTTVLAEVDRTFGLDNLAHASTLRLNGTTIETSLFQTDASGRVIAEAAIGGGLATPSAPLNSADIVPLLPITAWRYGLDDADNILSRAGQAAFKATIDAANRYATLDGQAIANVVGGGPSGLGGATYGWNGRNQLIGADVGAHSWRAQYDAYGRPSRIDDGAQSSVALWDGDILLGTAPSASGALTLNVGFNLPLLVNAANGTGDTAFYRAPDGSAFASGPAGGAVQRGFSYSAYGVASAWTQTGQTQPSATDTAAGLYKGLRYETGVQLYWTQARLYDPGLGRFLAPDPSGQEGGPNLFAFVGARPLSFSDPTGLAGKPAEQTLPFIRDDFAGWKVGRSFVSKAWTMAYEGATDPSLSLKERAGYGVLGLAEAPVAAADKALNFVLNTPHEFLFESSATGQRFARAYLTRDLDQQADRYGEAAGGLATAFNNGVSMGVLGIDLTKVTRAALASNVWFTEAREAALARSSTCEYCQVNKAVAGDHIIPVRLVLQKVWDGEISVSSAIELLNNPENIAASCQSCNSSKWWKLPSLTQGQGTWTPSNPTQRIITLLKAWGLF